MKEQFSTKNFSEDFDDKLKALEKNVATLKANESYKEAIKALETIEGEISLLREKY
ncbi:MAG: hypothetical protein LBG59_03045 [Candidatus Peribacteria bacterium]|nr:hypothetical protein [Candidatus Peribacteria bacterium]